jgi:hypothetical protein
VTVQRALWIGTWLTGLAAGCGTGGNGAGDAAGADADAGTEGTGPESGDGDHDSGDGDGDGTGTATTTGTKFDVLVDIDAGGGTPGPSCKVVDDMDAIGDCEQEAPPDSFEPEIQWDWEGENGETNAVVTPMVANLTDDNDDDEIDLCDVPDIVVAAYTTIGAPAHLYVLDGETGTVHFQIAEPVDFSTAPAIGDIDADGLPEIVTLTPNGAAVVAFEHDGTTKWKGDAWTPSYIVAMGLADLDNDGDVEIYSGAQLGDHTGSLLWNQGNAPAYSASTAVDMDGDEDLELVVGHVVYHHDGSMMWSANVQPGFPQVADLDDDGAPEVLLTNPNGITLLEDDGAIVYQDQRPTGDPAGGLTWHRPAAIHDMDGDDAAEYALSSRNNYAVYEADAALVWKATVSDQSGIAAGTAFDFIGDGVAEAMYADEQFMFIFDGMGQVLLQTARTSATGTEYPIVADADNDGSAEIVVVSNNFGMSSPAVQVVRDVEDRWIQARRIWNQHAYHVTNVREDATIPQFEPPHWETLNTFRTNAQIEGGGVCKPPPPG